jgi:tRNA(Ile)-lysidine synthase TilS/MesJ
MSWIRILRECPTNEVKAYADALGLPYAREKRSRDNICRLIDELEDKHPGSKYQLLRSIDELTQAISEK